MYNTKRWHEVQKHSTIQRNMVHHNQSTPQNTEPKHKIQQYSTSQQQKHTEQIHHKIRPKRDGIQTYLTP